MTFSDDLPSDCPLARAIPCNHTIYMIHQDENSFLTQAERGRATNATGEGACTRHGLSVFPSLASCKHQQSLFPRLGKQIVSASLQHEHGVIADTPATKNPKHMTWWPFKDVQRKSCFSFIDRLEG